MSNTVLLYELVCQHNEIARQIKAFKPTLEKERKLRDKIIQLAFTNPKVGTNKLSLKEMGLELKGVVKETWSVDEAISGDIAKQYCKAIVYPPSKPTLVKKEYDKLSDEDKKALAVWVSSKPGAPTLEYEGNVSIPLNLTAKDGYLYLNGSLLNPDAAENWCDFFGFTNSLELIKFLEELQA